MFFQLGVDGHGAYPELYSKATVLAPGSYNLIRLSMMKTFTTKDALAKSPLKRNCLADGEKMLDHFTEYTQGNCLVDAIVTAIEEGCGCLGLLRGTSIYNLS